MLRVKTPAGIAKLAGVVACLCGAATLAFYKGPHLELLSHFHFFLGYHKSQQHQGRVLSGSSWIKGCFLMLLSNTFWGMWLVLQVKKIVTIDLIIESLIFHLLLLINVWFFS